MKIDVKTVAQLAAELNGKLSGFRVEKVQQPERDTLLLTFNKRADDKLLINVHSGSARAQLTSYSFEQPPNAPAFCMLLRKYLLSAKLTAVTQIAGDRVLRFDFNIADNFTEGKACSLILELFGAANLLLCSDDGHIIDCLHKVGIEASRPALPGLLYEAPVPVASRNSADTGFPAAFTETAVSASDGMSEAPQTDLSSLFDELFTKREQQTKEQQRGAALGKILKTLRDRAARKLTAQTSELAATADRERFRESGDIIKANLHAITRGAAKLTADNFYGEGEITIELDTKLSPSENAARYYKRYRKAKMAETVLTKQIELGQNELAYLETVISELELARSRSDIDALREELTAGGYLKSAEAKGKKRPQSSKPITVTFPSGAVAAVGRNNLQNDELTFRQAARGDLWFHAQKIHGSHVVLRGKADENDIYAAAKLAAYHSKSRGDTVVPVDYCLVKYVKKPNGAKPGFVIYSNFQTVMVKPETAGK
ncbi:MAG: NFACT family protein [Oscillospiraceae bacterium]|jgi:predicted ribosome quality control (RQC) complex YloA/Tae2 family protein|nr:NFACT family protein [Oscillospiraceae bacterium]